MSVDDPLYDDTIQKLKNACEQYRAKTLNWDNLRDIVFQASDALGLFGEQNIRILLKRAVDQLEAWQFTVSGDGLFDETLKIVSQLEDEISKWE